MKRLITILLILFSCATYGQFHRHIPLSIVVPAPIVTTTLDPANKGTLVALTNGNLTNQITPTPGNGSVLSTIAKSSGKYYWEVTVTNASSVTIGVANISVNLNDGIGNNANGWSLFINPPSAQLFHSSGGGGVTGTFANGDIIGCALDLGAGTIQYYQNGVIVTGGLQTGLSGTLYVANGSFGTSGIMTTNFGATAFTYTVPSGYQAGFY